MVSRRHLQRSTVLTSNKAFSEWTQVFAGASCVSALIDRIVHRAEIVKIDGESYRKKEATERAEQKAQERAAKSRKRRPS